MKRIVYTFFFLSLVASSVCNTEIINFVASESLDSQVPPFNSWPVLSPDNSEIQRNMSAAPFGSKISNLSQCVEKNPGLGSPDCPHELWVVLDLDQQSWMSYSKFTLRLSWPAFHPADIYMSIHDPVSVGSLYSPQRRRENSPSKEMTRRKYARIHIVYTGVLTPSSDSAVMASRIKATTPLLVPFVLILEPLYFGVLPASMTQNVILIVFVAVLSLLVAPRMGTYLQQFVELAKKEIESKQKEE